MTGVRRTVCYLAIFSVIALLGACADDAGSGSTDSVQGAAMEAPAARDGYDYDEAALGSQGAGAGGGADNSVADTATGGGVAAELNRTPAIGPSVIKTAEVRLEVSREGFRDALNRGIAAAGRFGGFVVSSSVEGEEARRGSLVMRVPAENFEDALSSLEELGTVQDEMVSGRDVSQEFVDLTARIRNLEAQEVVLLRLMREAQSVVDTIRVQRELQTIQLEIERLRGREQFLRDQSEMSTISLSMVEVGAPGVEDPDGTLAKAWARAVEAALAVVGAFIVGAGALIPIAILAALGFAIFRALRPRIGEAG